MAEKSVRVTDEERKARQREYQKQWRINNPDKYKAAWKRCNAKQWQTADREMLRQRHKKWRDANPDHVRKKGAEYRGTNLEKERERSRKDMARRRAADPERARKKDAEYRKAHPDRIKKSVRKAHLKRTYGLTPAEYDAMVAAQGGRCGICRANKPGGNGRWHIDHCHDTNIVRKLLCSRCNLGLGHFQHSVSILQSAIRYLREFSTQARHRSEADAIQGLLALVDFQATS